MKRSTILMLVFSAIAFITAAGVANAGDIKKPTVVQVTDQIYNEATAVAPVAMLPVVYMLMDLDRESPISDTIVVSEELTDVFKMRIRPPPIKVKY